VNKFRFVWETTITDVAEKKLTVGGRRSVDGEAELFMESFGWYIRLGHVAIFAGTEKPELEKGDKVRLIIEKR
jgi:hypothetical protein